MALSAALPTLYEYYAGGNITSGLSVDRPQFTLNGKEITLYSGAVHYFRVPKQHWRNRLRKARAAGLNAVETYVPWNLHEPENGVFDFGNGTSDMKEFLDIQQFLNIAKEEDLLAIVRPGPYICAEWEWGGLPSWLLKEKGVRVRTSEPIYMKYATRYFNALLSLLTMLQFTKGGPIIAFQVENEYAYSPEVDLDYIQGLYDIFIDNGIVELLVTSDGASSGQRGTIPGLLFQTINFGSDPDGSFRLLDAMQPNKPKMAMEFYPGWFDHWSEEHHTVSSSDFRSIYESILAYPASVNLYMFHGGTNFGLLNGGNMDDEPSYLPTTTSYDYDAPLSEAGDYTEKYNIMKELIETYNPVKTLTPEPPELIPRVAYDAVEITERLDFNTILSNSESLSSESVQSFEEIGQNFGYLVYRLENVSLPENSVLTIGGYLHGTVMVVLNGNLISNPLTDSSDFNGFGYWRINNSQITLNSMTVVEGTLDLILENWGRVNVGNIYSQYEGLSREVNPVTINGDEIQNINLVSLPFSKSWISHLNSQSAWTPVDNQVITGPAFYRTQFEVDDPVDTFVNMQGWTKCVVVINGFVLGRYAKIGPQHALYLPAPFLVKGTNEILIFEHFTPDSQIRFSSDSIFT